VQTKGLEDAVARGMRYATDERLAAHYERHLVGGCHYRTPDVVAEVLETLLCESLKRVRSAERGTVAGDPFEKRIVGAPTILDLGAGTGLVGKAVARRGIAAEMWALDVSEPMLELIDAPIYVARRHADATGDLGVAERAFDAVVGAGLFEHVGDPAPVFRNAARVMKPGAAFVFTFPPNDGGQARIFDLAGGLVSHDPASVRACLAALGLAVTYETTFPAYESGSLGWVAHHLVAGKRRFEENSGQIC
jgi:predicted TPR repeat methyltransferase